jgi:translation initiation factor IF-2
MATINHVLEPDLAAQLAESLGAETLQVTFEEEVQLQQDLELGGERADATHPRAPVVTIMGHVDHGKTTLLDSIRESKITEGEAGGITQHIGAYHVDVGERQIVFLDTPGHEAFTLMRARGAQVTDIVVLVVAADDSVMPQTVEAIDHARAADVPIIVAINKMDKAGVNPDRVKKDLSNYDLTVEDWGGDVVSVPISALKGEGIDNLLEMILITADLLELKANPAKPAQGVVLEARKEAGKGNVATVLVQDGTLGTGDVFVSGAVWGRVRMMSDDRGERVIEAPPSTPVEVAGFNDLPEAGDTFQVVEEESLARGIVEFRQAEQRKRDLGQKASPTSLEQLFARIQSGDVKELSVVLKADVQGSVEVLTDTLQRLSTDQVKVKVIRAGVGAVTTHDVLLASASEAVIIGFNVRPERKAAELADKEEVEIRLHTVIYELSDELRKAMVGLLEPTYKEVSQGQAEVREIFKVPKVGTVAGCHVVEGTVNRNAMARLVRDSRVVYEGRIGTLRRFKDDVAEVRTGFDCGIRLENFQDLKPGDYIQTYVEQEVAPTL